MPRARADTGHRRVRMYVHGHLGWTEGFPEIVGGAVRWWRLDAAEPLAVDGALLHRSRRALGTVLRDHATDLPGVVGDVDGWRDGIEHVLARLKALLRGDDVGVELPAAARSLAVARPALQPLLSAAVTAFAARPAGRATVIRWLKAHADAVERIPIQVPGPPGVVTVLRLASLSVDHGTPATAALLAWASDPVADPTGSGAYVRSLAARVRAPDGRALAAPPPVATRVAAWLTPLIAADRGTQGRALALLALVDGSGPFRSWSAWWRDHQALLARGRSLAARHPAADRRDGARRIADDCGVELEVAASKQPVVIDCRALLDALLVMAAPERTRTFASLERLLGLLPPLDGRRPVRPLLLLQAVRHDDLEQSLWFWEAVADVIGDTADSLAPWQSRLLALLHDHRVPTLRRRSDAPRLAAAAAALARSAPVTLERVGLAGDLIANGASIDQTVAVVAAVAAADLDRYIDDALVRATLTIAGADAGDLAATLIVLVQATADQSWSCSRRVAALATFFDRHRAGWVLRTLLRDGRAGAVVDAADLAARIPPGHRPPPLIEAADSTWIPALPDELGTALTHLAAARADARAVALRLLSPDIADPDAVRLEIAALSARTGRTVGQDRRLRNLEARLRAPVPPSPARLARLAARVERSAAEAVLARFTADATSRATERLTRTFELGAWPGWPVDTRRLGILIALGELPARPRALAGRLLRARCGPRPWDLRDAAANQRFVERLAGRGIDIAPWLDAAPRAMTGASATAVFLALCDDPLEVVAMGEHFGTCLAADGGNFFSVVANAADINKRVIYARSASGDVVGRCLIALTDAGGLLTFRPYCHDPALRFDALVRTFVTELAGRMGTEVVGRGRVSRLLSDDWYDDGALDITGRFPALEDGSPLRRTLRAATASDVVALLQKHLGRALDDLTLPLVLALPEIQARPELVLALAPLLDASRGLGDDSIEVVARAAFLTGDHALADRLLGDRAVAALRRDGDHFGWSATLLARVRPSTALALLRETRPRHARRWADEPTHRLEIAAIALEALRRPRQAAALYRLMIAQVSRATAAPWRARARILEKA